MTENMWPDFDLSDTPPSPKAVIDQAGSGLREKTGGIVEFYRMSIRVSENTVMADYSLYSPQLAYHFPIMKASFPVDRGYPVKLVSDQIAELVANNETELVQSLERIFNAASTIETIKRLMSLAK